MSFHCFLPLVFGSICVLEQPISNYEATMASMEMLFYNLYVVNVGYIHILGQQHV
jgi:hypothetical protein